MEQSHRTFKFSFDRRTLYWSGAHIVVFALFGLLLYLLYEGGYFSAWFISLVIAILALMTLSIPRSIVVTDDAIDIICICDITEIPLDEIASVRILTQQDMKWHIPLFGGCGFFGYYGHFIDLRHFDRVVIYASEWNNFVEITDIYDDKVIVSCREAEQLVALLKSEESVNQETD